MYAKRVLRKFKRMLADHSPFRIGDRVRLDEDGPKGTVFRTEGQKGCGGDVFWRISVLWDNGTGPVVVTWADHVKKIAEAIPKSHLSFLGGHSLLSSSTY